MARQARPCALPSFKRNPCLSSHTLYLSPDGVPIHPRLTGIDGGLINCAVSSVCVAPATWHEGCSRSSHLHRWLVQ
jgi:hypothetical protein